MSARLRAYIRQHHLALLCLFLIVSGGTAYATHPGGQNTISTADIINGEVKSGDIGDGEVKGADVAPDSLGSGKIADRSVKNADLSIGASSSNTIADGGIQGVDVKNNTLTGNQVDESTLDIGDTARAYAWVNPLANCTAAGTCSPEQAKGVSSVTRDVTGSYCVTAPGIDATATPAAVTVDKSSTSEAGNASAMTVEHELFACGPDGKSFHVITERQPNVTVNSGAGVNNATAVGPAAAADDVAFTIVIP